MKNRFTLDLATGTLTRTLVGFAVPSDRAAIFTARDILECEVVLLAGAENVTAALLPEGTRLTLGLRRIPSVGPLLAMSLPQTVVDGVAQCVFDLNTQEIADLVASLPATNVSPAKVWFEIELSHDDGSARQTIAQQQCLLQREVITEGDEAPAQAAASALTASQHRDAAEQAAAASAADRVQTGLDRTAVAQDKDTVAGDRATVANDKGIVAADKATVAADKGIVAADKAIVAADKLAAGDHRNAADQARYEAENAAGAASDRASDAEGYANQAAADRVQTGIDRAAVAADKSTVAAGVVTAAGHVNTAQVAAGEAAASASQAQNAIALSFKGGAAGASVPATSTLAGDYYRITTAGTSQSKTWAVGDLAIYNGTSGQWTQIAGNVPSEDRTLRGDLTRRSADALFFSGPGANRRVYTPLGTAGAGVGANDFTLLFPFRVTQLNDNINRRALGGLSNVSTNTDVTDGLEVSIESNGDLRIASGATVLTYAGFRTPRPSEDGVLAIVRSITGGITTYWNGVALALTSGSASAFNSVAFTDAFLIQGARNTTERFLGLMRPALLVNFALSAADVLAHAQLGVLPHTLDLARGQAADVFMSDFSANTTGWSGSNGATIAAVGGRVEVTTGASTQHGMARTTSPYVTGFTDGQLYRLRFTYRLKSGTSSGWSVGNSTSNASWSTVAALAGATIGNVGSFSFVPTGTDQTADVLLRWNQIANGGFWFFHSAGTACVLELVNISFTPIGLLARPVIRSGRVMPDIGNNRNHAILTQGVTPITDDFNGVVIQNALTANGELIDTTGCVPTDANIASVIVRNTTANAVTGFSLSSAASGGGTVICAATNIPANSHVSLPLTQSLASVLTAGTYSIQGSVLGRLYYAATTWNSGSLNLEIRYRRSRGI